MALKAMFHPNPEFISGTTIHKLSWQITTTKLLMSCALVTPAMLRHLINRRVIIIVIIRRSRHQERSFKAMNNIMLQV